MNAVGSGVRIAADMDAVALEEGNRIWTHAELHGAVRGMAALLAATGIGAGDRVAVHAGRGAGLVVSLLALGALGATYVPVNPRLPRERVSAILASLSCAAILVEGDSIPPEGAERVLRIDLPPADAPPPGDATEPVRLALPDYIIHTSGSTGRSKPVLVGRDSLCRHVAAIIPAYGLRPDDKVLQICSPAFDVSIEEILPTLVAGARLVIAPDPAEIGLQAFSAHLDTASVTVTNLPTALWCAWLDHMAAVGGAPPPSLRLCVIGGEVCPPARVDEWLRLAPGVRCLNAYGLTETTITNCYWELAPRAAGDTPVPVGFPLGDNRLHVLDPELRPLPHGVAGELHVAGPWLAQGYLYDPALTADRYVPDPFSSQPGDRLFRTGDRAYFDGSGALVVVGRTDRQLKLHGYRLEPGEIEAALLAHPAIRFCYVAVIGDDERRALVAVVQVAPDVACESDALQNRASPGLPAALSAHLRTRVADYAVPSHYRFLRTLPCTPAGKVDVAALQAGCLLPASPADGSEASGSVEDLLHRVLGHRPDLSRSFYDIGGDSVLALRLITVLRQAGHVLAVKDLMSGRPLTEVLSTIRPLGDKAGPGEPLQRDGFMVGVRLDKRELAQLHANQQGWRDTEFFCAATPMQMQMLELSIRYPRSGNCIEQVEGRLQGIDPDRLRQAWEATCRRHEALRSHFNLRFPGRPLQVCRRQASLDWQVHDWRTLAPATRATRLDALLKADRRHDFRMLDAPLTRWQLIVLGDDAIHMIWTYHHALLDGWSDVMLLREVFAHYRDGDAARLPSTGSVRDYAHWLAGQDANASADYWRGALAALDHRRGWLLADDAATATTVAGGIVKLCRRLGPAATRALQARARARNVPASALIVAAFGAALMEMRDVDLAVFGQFVWVRPPELSALDHTAGMFVNLVPVVVRRGGDTGNTDAAGDMLRQQLAREPHLHLAADAIAATAPPARDGGPLLDAAIVFENYDDDGDPYIAALRSHAQSTIPLTCYVWPGDDLLLEVGIDLARLERGVGVSLLEAFAMRLVDADAPISVPTAPERPA